MEALVQQFQTERFLQEVSRLAAASRRLSINQRKRNGSFTLLVWPPNKELRHALIVYLTCVLSKKQIDSLGPTAAQVALLLSVDYGQAPQVVKAGVSAKPHQQGGNGARQNYPCHS